jgi:hypothetical protein
MNAKQAAIPNAKRACYVCEGTRRLVSISQLLYVLGTGRDGIGRCAGVKAIGSNRWRSSN